MSAGHVNRGHRVGMHRPPAVVAHPRVQIGRPIARADYLEQGRNPPWR